MSMKLKALGLGLLAMMAVGAFAVMNATAQTGGHFVSSVHHTTIKGTEDIGVGATDRFEFTAHGLPGGIVCDEVSYTGTATATTVESITVTPSYKKCYTTDDPLTNIPVEVTGCVYTFTVGKTPKEEPEGTVDLECGATGHIVIKHPSCTITITGTAGGANQNLNAFTYKTILIGGQHAITINAPKESGGNPAGIQFATRYEGGICIFTGTNHTGTLHGAATVQGLDTDGIPVSITATGP